MMWQNYSRIEQCGVCGREFEGCPFYETEQERPCSKYVLPVDNSGMFRHFFSTKGRIGRMEYVIIAIVALILMYVLAAYLGAWYIDYTGDVEALSDMLTASVIGCIGALPSAALLVVAGYKRCHDSTSPTWYAWVPSVSLFVFLGWISVVICSAAIFFLVFQKGDEGINAHGTEPGKPYDEQLREAGVKA